GAAGALVGLVHQLPDLLLARRPFLALLGELLAVVILVLPGIGEDRNWTVGSRRAAEQHGTGQDHAGDGRKLGQAGISCRPVLHVRAQLRYQIPSHASRKYLVPRTISTVGGA